MMRLKDGSYRFNAGGATGYTNGNSHAKCHADNPIILV